MAFVTKQVSYYSFYANYLILFFLLYYKQLQL